MFYFAVLHPPQEDGNGIDKEDETEKINRIALGIAREVVEDTGTLLAGGISNTDLFLMENEEDPSEKVRAMFEEQVRWSKEEGVDYVIAETIGFLKEAKIALEVIRSFDLPAVVTLAVKNPLAKKGGNYTTKMVCLLVKRVAHYLTWEPL